MCTFKSNNSLRLLRTVTSLIRETRRDGKSPEIKEDTTGVANTSTTVRLLDVGPRIEGESLLNVEHGTSPKSVLVEDLLSFPSVVPSLYFTDILRVSL